MSGSSAPYDLSGKEVAKWGQQNLPTDATAIFPPDEVPTSSPPSSHARATVYYMNVEGQLVNTATPSGAGTSAASITTVEPDEHGNILRELSAQNRLRAVAEGSVSVAKSEELDTHRTFSEDGTEMLEEWGPLHQIRLESGATKDARLHRVVQYENPAPPAGTPAYHLPTRETTGASIKGQGIDSDQRITETVYNWALRKPAETIVDPNGLKIRRYTSYDPDTGMPTEIRQPNNPNGGDAQTTQIHYYKASPLAAGPAACKNQPAKAGLPCEITPAAQPGTEGQPDLLVKKFVSYSPLGQPTAMVETLSGQQFRTSGATYDTLGRQVLSWQHGESGSGALLPMVKMIYNSTTGMPERQRFFCGEETEECASMDKQEIIIAHDELGRLTAYQDADESISTMTYDLLGRPATSFDGKGTQTSRYDSITGLLVELEDSAAGTFTASYDADGNLVERTLPNGLIAKTTFDEAGEPSRLTYTKSANCGASCTWLDFTASHSIYGQVNAQSSTLSSQQYSYDKAGRLEAAEDTPQGGPCTTRSYFYDDNSNRTKLETHAPGVGGACSTSAGSTQNYSYDAADRLIGSGISYDGAGRITSLPAAYAGGKTLSTTYYTNDLVATQTQDGVTNAYELDSALRPRLREQSGGGVEAEIFHYAGNSDSPAWAERNGEEWTRSIIGIGGELAATDDSSEGTILQLTNLHGDVVAIADVNPETTALLNTFEFDEFGNSKQAEGPRYGWLGGKTRRTELASGVMQMGVRSYVPAMGRFTSVDPVFGGSASGYDYANADPINSFDLDGMRPTKRRGLGSARAVRVGTVAIQSRVTLGTIGSIVRALKEVFADKLKIAWGTCIPSSELGVKLSVIKAFFGTSCIPKVKFPVPSVSFIPGAKIAGATWCLGVNAYLHTGTVLSMLGAQVMSGTFCAGNDRERAWAYVHVTS